MPQAMNTPLALDRHDAPAQPEVVARASAKRVADDKAMLRGAAELTRDLHTARPLIYWSDFLASALLGYAALAIAITSPSVGWAIAAGAVAILALYRAGSFTHELTHMKHSSVPW